MTTQMTGTMFTLTKELDMEGTRAELCRNIASLWHFLDRCELRLWKVTLPDGFSPTSYRYTRYRNRYPAQRLKVVIKRCCLGVYVSLTRVTAAIARGLLGRRS